MSDVKVSNSVLRRLPLYCSYLRSLPGQREYISATAIAAALKMGEVQVRKDLASICDTGKPKVGYVVSELLEALESYLGYYSITNAVLVGTGKLGRALLDYTRFYEYGLSIVAGFDINPDAVGTTERGKHIYHISSLRRICEQYGAEIGIITVPSDAAQQVCGMLIDAGVRGIWNFAPVHLSVPPDVVIKNENLAVSLALLNKRLKSFVSGESNIIR